MANVKILTERIFDVLELERPDDLEAMSACLLVACSIAKMSNIPTRTVIDGLVATLKDTGGWTE